MAALLVLTLTAVALGGLAGWQWRVAERERGQAEVNFRQARKAVDDFFTQVSESKLLNAPALEPLRKQLLEQALKYYQGFVQQRAQDPELQAELAATYRRVGDIRRTLGIVREAGDAYRKAIAIFDELLHAHPEVPEYQSDLAVSYNNLGFVQRATGDAAGARAAVQKALEIGSGLCVSTPRCLSTKATWR